MFKLKVEHSELEIDKTSCGRLYALLYWFLLGTLFKMYGYMFGLYGFKYGICLKCMDTCLGCMDSSMEFV